MPGWTGWSQLDSGYQGDVEALGRDADGRLDVFGLQPAPGGQAAAHNRQVAPNAGWAGWAGLGSPPQNDVLSHLGVARNQYGRLEVFVLERTAGTAPSSSGVWHRWQTSPGGAWS